MSLRIITPPTALPVSLEAAKAQVNLQHNLHDDVITRMILAAAGVAEQELNRKLMSQTWQLLIDEFPPHEIEIRCPRVQNITSIVYTDPDGVDQTLSTSAYSLDADLMPGYVLPALGASWPATLKKANAVRVTFVAGYGSTADAVPKTVQEWVLVRVATAYYNREAFLAGISVAELPGRHVDQHLDAERLYW
jgi:uncharacterized phiE125 gp8 family phage protein